MAGSTWNGTPAAAVTPLGQLPFFIEFLKVSGVFEAWVASARWPTTVTSVVNSGRHELQPHAASC